MVKRLLYGCMFLITAVFLLTGCGSKSSRPAGKETEKPAESAAAFSGTEKKGEYHKITAEEAKKMMEEGGVTVVDVRTAAEYEEGHIPGAIVVPVEEIGEEMPKELPDQDAVLLVHCRSGVRSKAASEKLIDLGYRNVYDFGGIKDWPYETVEGAE